MSLESEVRSATAKANNLRVQVRRKIANMMGKHRVARRLFLDEQGEVTPDAARFLNDLAREAGIGKRGPLTDEQLRELRGASHMVGYVLDLLALPENKLMNLQRQLEALKNE
jgi:polyhydroxyalkanoate synthesis regulator phasin